MEKFYKLISICSALLLTAGLVSSDFLILDLPINFLPQWTICNFILLLYFTIKRTSRFIILSLFSFTLGLFFIYPYLGVNKTTDNLSKRESILLMNIYTKNPHKKEAIDLIRSRNSSLVVVLEIDPDWQKELEELADIYPYSYYKPELNNFGLAILSKVPLGDTKIFNLSEVPAIKITLNIQERSVDLIALHTFPPVSQAALEIRNSQISQLQDAIISDNRFSIIAGDFNASLWNPIFRKLLKNKKLLDSRLNQGIQSTWPTATIMPYLYLLFPTPIDHLLFSKGLIVLDSEVVSYPGSDHRGMYAEFSFY